MQTAFPHNLTDLPVCTSPSRSLQRWALATSFPRPTPPRLVVSLQMLIDLVLIGVTAKLILGAARTGIERRRIEPKD